MLKKKKKIEIGTYNVLINFDIIGKGTLLDLLKSSKEKGFKPILHIYESFGNLDTPEGKTNILDSIFTNDYKVMSEFSIEQYYKMIPYFIYFGTDESIKNWWDSVRNSKSVYKVSEEIKKSDQYQRFKNIIGIDLKDASGMNTMGFGDD
jgi:hypothetical protein